MRYTLRHLEVFLAVAREESISKAAAMLCMSQSATSSALQEFENRYGLQLFDRGGKRLRLNSFGQSIRIKAESLMVRLHDFDRELKGQEDFGHLRIGASLTIGNYLAIKYLAAYMQQYPQARVEMEVQSSPEIVSQVLNFQVDIGLIEAELHHPDLSLLPWRADNMVIFCAASHSLAEKKQLSDQDLLNALWILREPDSGHRQTFDRSMQGLLPDLNIVLELRHNEAIKNAVKAGLGIGCLSEIAIADEIAEGSLIPLATKARSMHRNFYFVMRKNTALTQAVSWWMNLCQQEMV